MRLLSMLFIATLIYCGQMPAAERPNIVVILVDDMGFSDIGCYGSEIPTPNLDALAEGGVRFTQFYNTGRCCPTRASLLTGLYAHQTGVGHMTDNQGVPGYLGRLNDNCATIAEMLRPNGYFTAMSGKWHVGQNHGVTPWVRGFDRSLNAPAGGFYQPESPKAKLFLNGEPIENDDERLPANWYSTDLWTTFGLKFIDEAIAAKKPFFLYLAHNAPHFPLQAPEEEIAKFRGKYKEGWDKLRRTRHAKQIEQGIVDPSWQLAQRPDTIAAWDSLNDEEKDRFDNLMAVYAATVSRMDKAIGDLTAGLKERGQLDNTLILFMSDNGGNAEAGPSGRTNGDPTQATSNWFCGESWAFLQNTPFRLYKHYSHEGGIASPLIAHWPSGIAAKNELRNQPAHLIDIMSTCLDVSQSAALAQLNGKPLTPLEGRSLVPVFRNDSIERDGLFWEHEGNAAVRDGDWKLVRKGRNGDWELYNLAKDRTEQVNLATEEVERVKRLSSMWQKWAKRAHVKPFPKGKGNPANNDSVTQNVPGLEYSGKVTWDENSGTVTFLTSGSMPDSKENFYWVVPASVNKIVIEAGVTIQGGFRIKYRDPNNALYITGRDRKTSIIEGTDQQKWTEKAGIAESEKWRYGAINVVEDAVVHVANLTSRNSRGYNISGYANKAVIHVDGCDLLDTRGGDNNNSDGFIGSAGSSIRNSFISTSDDAIKIYHDITIENVTIEQHRNGAPLQFGWGGENDTATATIKNLTIHGVAVDDSYNMAPLSWVSGQSGVRNVNIDGLTIELQGKLYNDTNATWQPIGLMLVKPSECTLNLEVKRAKLGGLPLGLNHAKGSVKIEK